MTQDNVTRNYKMCEIYFSDETWEKQVNFG